VRHACEEILDGDLINAANAAINARDAHASLPEDASAAQAERLRTARDDAYASLRRAITSYNNNKNKFVGGTRVKSAGLAGASPALSGSLVGEAVEQLQNINTNLRALVEVQRQVRISLRSDCGSLANRIRSAPSTTASTLAMSIASSGVKTPRMKRRRMRGRMRVTRWWSEGVSPSTRVRLARASHALSLRLEAFWLRSFCFI
jgi:hypothetical protein